MQPVPTGIPQGSPASPILFLLYVCHLFDELNRQQPLCWTPNGIDGVPLVVTGKTRAHNARQLEAAARVAFQWANNNAVAFDDSKTEWLDQKLTFRHHVMGKTVSAMRV